MPDPVVPGAAGVDVSTPVHDAAADEARLHGVLKKSLPKYLEEALAPYLERFQAPAAPKAPAATAATPGDETGRRLAELEAELTKTKTERASERQTALEERTFGELRTALTGRVRPDAVDAAAKLLFHAEKAARISGKGKVTYHLGDDEFATPREFVDAYVKSPGAAIFLPPPGYGGAAGKRPTTAPKVPVRGGTAPLRETPLEKARRRIAALPNQ